MSFEICVRACYKHLKKKSQTQSMPEIIESKLFVSVFYQFLELHVHVLQFNNN